MALSTFLDRRRSRSAAPVEDSVAVEPATLVRMPAILRGTRVVSHTPLADEWGAVYGWDLLVRCADITQHAGTFQQQIPAIAGAFGTVDAGVTVYRTSTNQTVRVRVVTSWWLARQERERESRIRERHPWPGPTLDPKTGRFEWARLADGGTGYGRLWLPDDADPTLTQGARPWWFTGRTRGGKTGSMATAMLSAVTEGVVYPCVIDMQGGVSLGEWMDRGVPFAGNAEEADVLARRVLLEGHARNAWMTARGENGFGRILKAWPTPTPDLPIILLVVDEAPALSEAPETMAVLAKIMREQAKAGIAVWWSTQMHQTMQAFGYAGGDAARQQMKAGSVSQFSGSAGARAEAFDVMDSDDMDAVTELPKGIAGAHLHQSPDHEVPVLGRAFYEPNIERALDRHARIPDYELPDIPGATARGDDPAQAKDCDTAVRSIIGAADSRDVLETGAINAALQDRWQPRTIRDAIGRAVDAGLIEDAGRGKWRVQ